MSRKSSVLIACAALICVVGCGKKRPAPKTPAMVKPGTTETGVASWYGHPYHGRRAANGEVYDMETLVAAHRTWPFGAMGKVTNLTNGKSVDVRIIDRGPFVRGRIIDLSRAAAREIAMIGPGTAKVKLLVLGYTSSIKSDAGFAVQVGAFTEKNRAEQLSRELKRRYSPVEIVPREGRVTQWRVLVGNKNTQQAAEALAAELSATSQGAFVVRLDSLASDAGSSGR